MRLVSPSQELALLIMVLPLTGWVPVQINHLPILSLHFPINKMGKVSMGSASSHILASHKGLCE